MWNAGNKISFECFIPKRRVGKNTLSPQAIFQALCYCFFVSEEVYRNHGTPVLHRIHDRRKYLLIISKNN